MAFTEGFWAANTVGSVANMNACLLGWGPKGDFPAAAAGNKGRMAWATDEELMYYSSGSAWVPFAFLNALAQAITGIKTFGSIPVLPATDPTTANQAARKSYVDNLKTAPSDDLMGSSDSEVSYNNIAPYALKKSLTLKQGAGTSRIKFDLKSSSATWGSYAKIYRNGSPIGIERYTTSTTYVTYSEDIANWVVEDAIQIYGFVPDIEGTPQSIGYIRNFRVYAHLVGRVE